mmetsp:Transcript_59466/g.134618  ORF Transcript_59466/g.134618 Transcript_59466/m.134618 type:complete len:362 (+) Transcript_59466:22-1107(+)
MPLEHFKHGAVQRKISPWGKAWTGGQGKAGAASRIKASESGAFRAPSWAQKLDGYRAELDVVLNGEIAHERPLDRFSCYLVGKSQDVCNLPLDHPSISRQHAVFVHSKLQVCYLADLKSSHGTAVGNGPHPALAPFSLLELRSGRCIRFGGSSRRYIFRAFLDADQIAARFPPEADARASVVEDDTEEDSCSNEVCRNSALNARVSYLLEADEIESKTKSREEESSPAKRQRTTGAARKVAFEEAPPTVISTEGGLENVDKGVPLVGKFSSLVSTKTVVVERKSGEAKNAGSSTAAASNKVVTQAEQRRRLAQLMDMSKKASVPPQAEPSPILELPAPVAKPRLERVERDADAPMDLRKVK